MQYNIYGGNEDQKKKFSARLSAGQASAKLE
jgi:hypothetical protein